MRASGAGCQPRERGAGNRRQQGECPGTLAGGRLGHTRQGARAPRRARRRGQQQRRGQSAGSGRRNAGQGATKGPGHREGSQGREQGAKAGGHGAHGVERGAVGERGRSQGHGHGHGKGTGAGSAGQGAGDRERDPRHGQGDRGVGAGKGPKGKGKGAVGPRGQTGQAMGALRGGQSEGRGTRGGPPLQPDVQPVRCILPGIQQMPAHHTHHHHHHHAHLYNIDMDAGELIPSKPPRPQHQPAPPAPRAEPARMAAALAGGERRGAAPAPQAQGPQGELTRGAGGPGPPARYWGTVRDPYGDEALPLVVEVYGWLSWACSGTTRGMRNRPFDAVLLRRDGGNRGVPPRGMGGPGGPREGPPDGDPGGMARQRAYVTGLPGGGAVLRITDADANN